MVGTVGCDRDFRRAALVAAIMVLIGGVPPYVAGAFEAGDVVVPIRDVEIKLDGKAVGACATGWCCRVLKAKGDRIWVAGGKAGWINAEDVIPLADAVEHFSAAIKNDPKNAELFRARGCVRTETKDFDRAIQDFDQALLLAPRDVTTFECRATCHLAMRKFDEALHDHDEVVRLDPAEMSYNNRGYTRMLAGKYQEAIDDLEAAAEAEPPLMMPLANLAFLYACCPEEKYRDGKKAVTLVIKVCEDEKYLDPDDLHILACAYAETGKFDKAVRWEKKSLELTPADRAEARKVKQRALEAFQAQKPFHEISFLE